MAKFLIVPGLPKSGTTFMYAQLSAQLGHFNVPSERKEIDYFRRGNSLEEYKKLFVESNDDKVYLDCSPLYADDIVRNTEAIKEGLAGHDVKVVLCVRNPFERMYSHYLHDIAQNFQIMGQGVHSIYMPSVMSRYIYPLTKRIKHYQSVFGRDNVVGFSFANKDTNTEDFLREFAGLPREWSFDFSKNPAAGFTSPTTYYSNHSDITIASAGSLYVLPKHDMLVANRQFSSLHRGISPEIGNNIMKNMAFIDRQFDGTLMDGSANKIWDDYEEALALLQLNVSVDRSDVVFSSQVSSGVPEKFLNNLKCIGTVDTVVDDIFANPLRSTAEAIIDSIEPTVSLSSTMAKLDQSAKGRDADGKKPQDYLEYLIDNYGPSPYFVELLLRNWLRSGKVNSVIQFMEKYPKSNGLFRPVQLASYIDDYRNSVSDDDYEKIVSLCG